MLQAGQPAFVVLPESAAPYGLNENALQQYPIAAALGEATTSTAFERVTGKLALRGASHANHSSSSSAPGLCLMACSALASSAAVFQRRLRNTKTSRGARRACFVEGGASSLRLPHGSSSVSRRVFDRFREDAIGAIYSAQEEAVRLSVGEVSTELILLAILAEDQKGGNRMAKNALVGQNVTRVAVKREVERLTQEKAKGGEEKSLPFSENAKQLFNVVNEETSQGTDIGCENLLLALGNEKLAGCGAAQVFSRLGTSPLQIQTAVSKEMMNGGSASASSGRDLAAVGAGDGDDKKLKLAEVATDLTQMAEDGLLDPVIGREEETDRIIQILLRKRKNNACLVGPAGVGKTAVAEGFAQRVVAGKVPSRLRGKRVFSLDLGLLVAGTKYRGEFEERMKAVIDEVKSNEQDICLFIDEIHQLVGAGQAGADASMDAANMLKPALARGELQVIGATTTDEYTRYIEKDAALERRFQKVACEEPSVEESIDILEGLRAGYEEHHGVLLSPEALVAAATLSQRYLPERRLPDKAIDLIDEAGSAAQILSDYDGAGDAEEGSPALEKPLVTAADIAKVISKWSGVPLQQVGGDEAARLMGLEDALASKIVGQQQAVSALGRAVRRSRAGLSGATRPIATLYFAGPTGVGKTELCKVLSSEYYLDPKAMIRLDMSEYSESHSVSRLVGPPPGYVGYDDPRAGQLTEAVRRRPYSVVVLDEIEKAHGEVMNLLLQVLEDGRLTDGKGRTVTFSNCMIIMTSNVGSREILERGNTGGYEAMRAAVQAQLQQRFRPEFLNRIDELLVFRSLSVEDLRKVLSLELTKARDRAVVAASTNAGRHRVEDGAPQLKLSWTPAFEDLVLEQGADTAYGARPLRRAVQRLFEDPLAELLVSGDIGCSSDAVVDVEDKSSLVVRCGGKEFRPRLLAEWGKESEEVPITPQAPASNNVAKSAVAIS